MWPTMKSIESRRKLKSCARQLLRGGKFVSQIKNDYKKQLNQRLVAARSYDNDLFS